MNRSKSLRLHYSNQVVPGGSPFKPFHEALEVLLQRVGDVPVSSRASTVASATTESERRESCGDKQSKENNMNHHVGMVEQVRLCTKTDLIILRPQSRPLNLRHTTSCFYLIFHWNMLMVSISKQYFIKCTCWENPVS